MTSAGVHESVAAEPPVPAAGAKASAPPAALDGLRAAAGNRGFGSYVRTLARQPAAPAAPAGRLGAVTVYLAGPPPPIRAFERATIPNRRLAALIDEIDELTDAQVIERRSSEVAEAEAMSGTGAEAHQLALEAAEYVAGYRHLEPLRPYYSVDTPAYRRRNVRVALEEGVREHHSFKKAFAQLPEISDGADGRRFFEREEETFRTEFKHQAKATALAMLDASQREMERVLRGYGLPAQAALFAADRISRGAKDAEADTEATAVINRALQTGEVDTQEHQDKRQDLAETVGRLKRQKALFDQLEHEAGRAALDELFGLK